MVTTLATLALAKFWSGVLFYMYSIGLGRHTLSTFFPSFDCLSVFSSFLDGT